MWCIGRFETEKGINLSRLDKLHRVYAGALIGHADASVDARLKAELFLRFALLNDSSQCF